MAQQDILLTEYTTTITPAEVQAALPEHVYEIEGDWVTVWGRKGERAVLAWVAAETKRREAAAPATPAVPAPATARQLDYIRTLIAKRAKSGDADGFMAVPADLTTLTKADASTLIDSLTTRY